MAGFEVITEANSPGEPDPSTSSSSAPPVDGVLTRLGENGQYWGDLALLKRMAWAAESAKSALWCPAAASLSLSPSWPALLVNSYCGKAALSSLPGLPVGLPTFPTWDYAPVCGWSRSSATDSLRNRLPSSLTAK